MPRPEKVQAVTEIKERMESARAVFLAEYAGLSVKQQQALRRGLRAKGAEFKVVKMTLARRAAAQLDIADIDELLLGPTGIAFADDDPVVAAKALRDFAKDHEALKIKGGLLLGDFLTPERISELADLEPRDVLLGKIAGAMKAPLFKTANLLAALPRNTASIIKALIDKRVEAGETPAGETPVGEAPAADEAPTDEAPADEAPADEAPAEPVSEAADAATDAVAEAPEGAADDTDAAAEAPEAEAAVATDEEPSEEDEPAEQAEEE